MQVDLQHTIAPQAADRLYRAQSDYYAAKNVEVTDRLPSYAGLPSRYQLVGVLGNGTFSTVYRAIDLTTNTNVAVKVVHVGDQHHDNVLNPVMRNQHRSTERASILQEVQIMRNLRHPNIVQLLDFIETQEFCYLVMEMVNGGELFDQIIRLTYMSEDLSRHIIRQVAEGIRFMHLECGIVHRDIKPENLLFEKIDTEPSDVFQRKPYDEESKVDEGKFVPGVGGGGIGRVKLADFGLSKIVWQQSTKTPCGTVGYAAPEIVRNEQYSLSVDMWALGCVLYTLLCGFPPFYDESIKNLSEKVSHGDYTFLSPWWDDISFEAKDLVAKLLCVDVEERLTIAQFFEHPWIKNEKQPSPKMPVSLAKCKAKTWSQLSKDMSVDSPLLASLHGNDRYDYEPIMSPINKVHLGQAFDVSFAVHRIEEEMRQARRMNELALPPPHQSGDSTANDAAAANERYGRLAAKVILDKHNARKKRSRKAAATVPRGGDEFNLSIDGATILQRRKRVHESLPLPMDASANVLPSEGHTQA